METKPSKLSVQAHKKLRFASAKSGISMIRLVDRLVAFLPEVISKK